MNRTRKFDDKTRREVVDEVIGKIKKYENKMSYRLARWVEAAELYQGKTSTANNNSKISNNSPELFKSIRAIRNMMMRMILGTKPSFSLVANDVIGYEHPDRLIKAEHFVQQQMGLANFPVGLAAAIDSMLLYGTVAVHNPYEPVRASYLGKKQYVTQFRPLSLINCAFSMDSYNISECGWVALSDVQSKKELSKLLSYDPDGKIYDKAEIAKCQEQNDYAPEVNTWVTQRLAWQGYLNQRFEGGIERVTYYGPLDCIGEGYDGADYCVEIVNREFIIRAEEYTGLRPVRIAAINNLPPEPLGNGMGDMFRPILGEIDEAKSAMLNMITLAGASMFRMQKDITDEDAEFYIRQFGIARTQNPLEPIGPNPSNLTAVAQFMQDRIQTYRQASGATDTLQALVTGDQATATATSLAMNEAVRNVSLLAELCAPYLHRDYVKQILENAQKYNTEPMVVPIGGIPAEILPSELLIDVNVDVNTSTDQDFRPAKLMRMREGLQVGAMFGQSLAAIGKKFNPGPVLTEYFKDLDIPNYDKVIEDMTDEDLLRGQLAAQMSMPQQGGEQEEEGENEESGGEERVSNGKPGKRERRMLNRNMAMPMANTTQTPVGQVMSAPGDQDASTKVIRSSITGGK
jgi:hypothetical protein